MGFKLNSPIKIDNVPQYEVAFTYDNNKDTEITPVARANDNFSIIYDKNQHDPKLRAEAKSHEAEHLRQMFGAAEYKAGDLKYGPEGVEYKGKFYNRNNPNFDESDATLPYEAPAYEAGKKLKDPTIIPKEFNQPMFSKIGERGPDNLSVSANEKFGVGPKKWYSAAAAKIEGTEEEDIIGGGDEKNKKLKEQAEKEAQAKVESVEWQVDPETGKEFREASATATSEGEKVEAAKGGKKTEDTEGYLASLKERFPGATGQELVDKGYISSSYMDRFPSAQQEEATVRQERAVPISPEPPETPEQPETPEPPGERRSGGKPKGRRRRPKKIRRRRPKKLKCNKYTGQCFKF